MIALTSGSGLVFLGHGNFDSPTEGAKTHTYTLEIYFPNLRYRQNDNQEKVFKAHIKFEDYSLENDRLKDNLERFALVTQTFAIYNYNIDMQNDIYERKHELSPKEFNELTNYANELYELYLEKWDELFYNEYYLDTTIEIYKIESITFLDQINIPSEVLGSFDVSKKQNESVMLWYTDNDENDLYEVMIGQEGRVRAPISC